MPVTQSAPVRSRCCWTSIDNRACAAARPCLLLCRLRLDPGGTLVAVPEGPCWRRCGALGGGVQARAAGCSCALALGPQCGLWSTPTTAGGARSLPGQAAPPRPFIPAGEACREGVPAPAAGRAALALGAAIRRLQCRRRGCDRRSAGGGCWSPAREAAMIPSRAL